MAIQSIDQFLAAVTAGKKARLDFTKSTGASAYVAGRAYSWFTMAGHPVAGSYSGTALNAQVLNNASQGAPWHGGNVSPDSKSISLLSLVSAVATAVPGTLYVVDLLLYYPGINMNIATLQTLVNTASLTRSTNGEGVRAFLETTVATGATAHNISMTYTDSDGNTGNTLPVTVAGVASSPVSSVVHSGTAVNNYGPFLPMASGDKGVRSVQSIQLSAGTGAGTSALVLCKVLTTIGIGVAGAMVERNTLTDLPSFPVVPDGACLGFIFVPGAATAANTPFQGSIETVWG